MGGLVINPEIRCLKCFHIYLIEISPNFPKCSLLETCKCGTRAVDISNFLPNYKANKKLIIYCFKCDKKNIKDATYCERCKKLYCSRCLKIEHMIYNPQDIHRYIPIDKYDFFCINHQNENFCAYCKTCQTDICNKCLLEKLHDGHMVIIYNKMYNEKKMEEFYKKGIKLCKSKIEHNRTLSNKILKKFKKNELKDEKRISDLNEFHNKFILEVLDIFHEIYGSCKYKNFAVISNILGNIDFNFYIKTFEKSTSKEKELPDLINYLKNDYIIKIKSKKTQEENKMEVPEETKQEKIKVMPIIALEGIEINKLKKVDENKENEDNKEKEENKEKVESVVNIVQSQIINKNNKKKPRKINFDV